MKSIKPANADSTRSRRRTTSRKQVVEKVIEIAPIPLAVAPPPAPPIHISPSPIVPIPPPMEVQPSLPIPASSPPTFNTPLRPEPISSLQTSAATGDITPVVSTPSEPDLASEPREPPNLDMEPAPDPPVVTFDVPSIHHYPSPASVTQTSVNICLVIQLAHRCLL